MFHPPSHSLGLEGLGPGPCWGIPSDSALFCRLKRAPPPPPSPSSSCTCSILNLQSHWCPWFSLPTSHCAALSGLPSVPRFSTAFVPCLLQFSIKILLRSCGLPSLWGRLGLGGVWLHSYMRCTVLPRASFWGLISILPPFQQKTVALFQSFSLSPLSSLGSPSWFFPLPFFAMCWSASPPRSFQQLLHNTVDWLFPFPGPVLFPDSLSPTGTTHAQTSQPEAPRCLHFLICSHMSLLPP